MDHFSSLNWSAKPNASNAGTNSPSPYPALRPTPPISGRASPFNPSNSNQSSKPATPSNDSFSNLVAFNTSGSSTKNLSLLEQQKRLADLKLQNEGKRKQAVQDQYAGGNEDFWNNLGSGRSTPAQPDKPLGHGIVSKSKADVEEEDDLFAAFNSSDHSAKLNNSTKLGKSMPGDDDDPFGLSEFSAQTAASNVPVTTTNASTKFEDDDDVLGLLGQPVSKVPKLTPELQSVDSSKPDSHDHPQDKALAELVDMGFPSDKARTALESTESGVDVQAAVGILLTQAHSESRQKSQSRNGVESRNSDQPDNVRKSTRAQQESNPRWQNDRMNQSSGSRKQEAGGQADDRDAAQIAAEFGNNFLKTANSLWKQGSKRVQQAVQEFNSDSDSNQPKWMREPERPPRQPSRPQPRRDEINSTREDADGVLRRPANIQQSSSDLTDEAMMLEASRPPPPPRPTSRVQDGSRSQPPLQRFKDSSPSVPTRSFDSKLSQTTTVRQQERTASGTMLKHALSRQAAEEQASQAYVSSARRRKPLPEPSLPAEPALDLLEQTSRPVAPRETPATQPSRITHSTRTIKSTPTEVRPPVPIRDIPSITDMSLKASHSHREKGNEHFKRGDYSSAHQSYTASISHLPHTHPVIIILLTNRALTALKIGEPKTAISDADKAITVIGPSKGESETIDLKNGEVAKPMRDYYGKALMRKAEALEQMEKWAEAASIWREAVEGGHGGSASIQGRMRAEKAANPQVRKPKPTPAKKLVVAPKRSALADLNGQPTTTRSESSAAVNRLRAANAAAEQADDEKFRLSDAVEAKITGWKGGKADNLRALLGSLDTVLWPEAAWKKISMADLVLPNKVKIQYMKGIAKVHPDKIPTNATTEQRMIAGAVFSTLNEAWDKFKAENNL